MKYELKETGYVYTEKSMNILITRWYKASDFTPTNHYYELWSRLEGGEWYYANITYSTLETVKECIARLERMDEKDRENGVIPEWVHHEYDIREVVE